MKTQRSDGARQSEGSIALWLLAGCAALVLLAHAFRAHWLLLTRNDLGIPRGFYACAVHTEPGVRTRHCSIGVDGAILLEEQFANGTVQRTWYAVGRIECSREWIGPTGVSRVLRPDECRRISEEER